MTQTFQRFITFVMLVLLSCNDGGAPGGSGGAAALKGITLPTLTAAQVAEVEKICAKYGANYSQAIKNTPGALAALKIPAPLMETLLKSICTTALAKAAVASSNTTDSTTSTDVDVGTTVTAGKLGIITMQTDTSHHLDQKDVLSAALKESLAPLLKYLGLDSDKASSVAAAIADVIAFLDHGFGAIFSVQGQAGVGLSAGLSMAFQMIYTRPSGPGEIGFLCQPGVMLGTGIGVKGQADFGYTKALGCTDTHSLEGGYLVHPISLGNFTMALSIGVDEVKLIDYYDYLYKAPWSTITTPEKLLAEMDLFNKQVLQILKTSDNPLEVIAVVMYLMNVGGALRKSEVIQGMAAGFTDETRFAFKNGYLFKDFDVIFDAILRQITDLNIFKSPNRYSSFKVIFGNLLAKLTPETDWPFNRTLLTHLIAALSDCDMISFTEAIVKESYERDGFLKLKDKITFTYAINPQFQSSSDTYDKKLHLILDLASFADFSDPKKWEALAQKLKDNVAASAVNAANAAANGATGAANSVANGATDAANSAAGAASSVGSVLLADTTGLNPPGCVLQLTANGNSFDCIPPDGLQLGGIGSDAASFTGLDEFGPLAFLGNMLNLLNPTYFSDQCLKPAADEIGDIATKVKEFFSDGSQGLDTQTDSQTNTQTTTQTN